MASLFPLAADGDSSSAAEDADLGIERDDYDLSDDSDNPGPSFTCHFMEVFSLRRVGLTVKQLILILVAPLPSCQAMTA